MRDDARVKKLKIGIIGIGGIARDRHIPALMKLTDRVELVGISDLNEQQIHDVAMKYSIPYIATDYRYILTKVDAVIICTPNKFHASIAIDAMEAGCHVLCEKPMAINVSQCENMLEVSQRSGKYLAIGYHYRYSDASQLAKKSMTEGIIGEALVTRMQAMRQRKVPSWGVFTNKDLQGGGSLIDYGCHLLDMAFWLLGNPKPVEVLGRIYNRLSKTPGQINDWGLIDYEAFDVDDHVTGYVTFEDGSSLMLECSWAANIKEDTLSLTVSGTESGMSVYPFELYKPHHHSMTTKKVEASHDEKIAGERQLENFVDSCLGEEQLVVKPEQALLVNRVIAAIYESSDKEMSVRL